MDATEEARHAASSGAGGNLLERLAERIGGMARAKAVYGPPVERGTVTVVPVARVRWGVGAGGGDSETDGASGSGGGGGVVAEPVGYIEVTSAGATFQRIGHPLASPGLILALAIAAGIVLRALGKLRR